MNILGISAFYSHANACLVKDGQVAVSAREETFSGIPNDTSFPVNAIEYCLAMANIPASGLDAIVFFEKPFLKLEKQLETYYAYAPRGVYSFATTMPVRVREKLFTKAFIKKQLKKSGDIDLDKTPILFSECNLSLAAATFYPAPIEESTILIIDGQGEWATTSICHGHKNNIKIIKDLRYPNSLGILRAAFRYYLGLPALSTDKEFLALASEGNLHSDQTTDFRKIIMTEMVYIAEDGTLSLSRKFFRTVSGLSRINASAWKGGLGFERRRSGQDFKPHHYNLALALQGIWEEVIVKLARESSLLTGSENLCLAGDLFTGDLDMEFLEKAEIFKNIYMPHGCTDDCAAIGAALAVNYIYFKQKKTNLQNNLIMQ